MHWDNGRFHKDLIVGESIYLTDYKFNGISGSISAITFGDSTVRSNLYGKNITIEAAENANLKANGTVEIEANDIGVMSNNNIGIRSKTASIVTDVDLGIQSNKVNIISTGNDINIESAQNIKLNVGNAITISSTNYGTTLPTTGNSEGRIFFKLIS